MICINCNKQYRSSVNIPGLYYCVDCDTFIYDNEGPQLEIDLHIVFKAINEITGSEALLFSTRCIALVSDIVAFDVSKKNIFLEMLQAYPNLSSEMIALNCKEMSKKSINDIKKNIKKKTG